MKYISMKYLSLCLLSFATLSIFAANEPDTESLAYKIMCVENFINRNPHFFNVVRSTMKVMGALYILNDLHTFHGEMAQYMIDEHDNFLNTYDEASENITARTHWYDMYKPWICKHYKTAENKIISKKMDLNQPSLPVAIACAYFLATGIYGLGKEANRACGKCISYITNPSDAPEVH